MTQMVRLGEVLHRSEEVVSIRPDVTYREVTVRLWGKGVVERRQATGAELAGSRRFVVRSGQFILSRIDARNGASGLVPDSLDGAVVSNDFPVFAVDPSRTLPAYMGWIGRAHQFVDICRHASEGTTNRVRLQEERFLNEEVHLPPLEEQLRIVGRIEEVAQRVQQAARLGVAVRDETHHLLPAITSRLYTRFRDCREAYLGELGPSGSNPIQTGPFGAQLHSSEFTEAGVPVLNVGNVTAQGLDKSQLDFVTKEKAARLTRYRLQVDDLLFARTGATLGKVCLVPLNCDGWLMTGHLFRVRFDQTTCNPKFAFAVLRGAAEVREQVF
jgi:type I restriction enzyme S subunit